MPHQASRKYYSVLANTTPERIGATTNIVPTNNTIVLINPKSYQCRRKTRTIRKACSHDVSPMNLRPSSPTSTCLFLIACTYRWVSKPRPKKRINFKATLGSGFQSLEVVHKMRAASPDRPSLATGTAKQYRNQPAHIALRNGAVDHGHGHPITT